MIFPCKFSTKVHIHTFCVARWKCLIDLSTEWKTGCGSENLIFKDTVSYSILINYNTNTILPSIRTIQYNTYTIQYPLQLYRIYFFFIWQEDICNNYWSFQKNPYSQSIQNCIKAYKVIRLIWKNHFCLLWKISLWLTSRKRKNVFSFFKK